MVLASALLPGCGSGGGLTGSQAAAPLPEFDDLNRYSPYYATGEMASPRYLHQIIRLASGQILAVSGSDENGFSALDTAEVFDQSTIKSDEVEPESIVGTWFDTNFEGDPIVVSIPRIFFTLTELPDNRIIMIGGSPNLNQALPAGDVEVFDPLTRTFETIDAEMVEPRFRHTATLTDDGRILILGGQIHTVFTENQNAVVAGGGQQGQVQIQIQRDIFPTTRENEFYSITDEVFGELTLPESSRKAILTPSRGRAGHTVARFAGPDNRLNTGDDLFLLVGGYQTASGENAPQDKIPGQGGGLTQLEFYDPVVGIFTEIPVIRMNSVRVNDPAATNLGLNNEFTPDGVLGMGNAILVTLGDNNAPAGGRVSAGTDEVFIATFTGFGPAQGLQFFSQDSPFGEHIQGIEAFNALGGQFETPVPPGRTTTNIVPLPHRLDQASGGGTTTWVYTGGGAHVFVVNGQQVEYYGGTVGAGAIFDPFYSLTAIVDFDSSSRDLRPGRRNNGNPVGVIGTWLVMDGLVPTTGLEGFGDTAIGEYPVPRAGTRAWTRIINVGGVDGIADTLDDRILFVGGGNTVFAPGGEPSFPSSELFVLPGTGSDRR